MDSLRELSVDLSNLSDRYSEEIEQAYYEAHDKVFVESILDDVEQYIPYLTGNLNSQRSVDYDSYIIGYGDCDYAKYAFEPMYISKYDTLEYKVYTDYPHENACGDPLNVAMENHTEEWAEQIVDYMVDQILYEVEL